MSEVWKPLADLLAAAGVTADQITGPKPNGEALGCGPSSTQFDSARSLHKVCPACGCTSRIFGPAEIILAENDGSERHFAYLECGRCYHKWTHREWTVKPEQTEGRVFEGGAYRDTVEGKPDYSGYLSPIVLRAYGEYMLKHQKQSNGEMRRSDNWKAGMPKDVYVESGFRHFMDLWLEHEGHASRDGIDEALGGLLFNVCGYWHELLKERQT